MRTDDDALTRPSSPRRHPGPRRRAASLTIAAALLLATALVAGACAGDDDDSADDAGTTTTSLRPGVPVVDDGPDDPAFATPGPYEVGVTTLELPDRKVEVWYPAAEGSTDGQPEATYSQLDALPPDLAAAAPALLPADVPITVLTVTMPDTFRDVPGSDAGPFPLVLFSHGFGSYRMDASALLRGIASWGFVVAAPDHTERGRAAMVTGGAKGDTAKDVAVLMDTITLVADAPAPLAGLADTDLVGAVGHSAGGRAVLTALSEPEVDVAVGWAAAGRADGPAPEKPSMNIAAREDILVPLTEVEETYAGLAPPKRLVVIDGAGHNSFTDICLAVAGGNDLIGLAERVGIQIPDELAEGGKDGCSPESTPPATVWAITQNFTVAELREGLGLDDSGTGLGKGVADEFDAEIEYRQDLG
jgi:predicted dienelactone hydrolase